VDLAAEAGEFNDNNATFEDAAVATVNAGVVEENKLPGGGFGREAIPVSLGSV
jgi:hypothetical protein